MKKSVLNSISIFILYKIEGKLKIKNNNIWFTISLKLDYTTGL